MTADCRQSTVLMGFHAFASLSIRRFCAHSVSGLSAPACVSPSSVCLLGAVVFVAMLSEAGWCKSPTDFQKLKIEMICSKGQVWYIYLHSSTESRRCRSWWCWAAGRCSGFTLTSHTSIWEQNRCLCFIHKAGQTLHSADRPPRPLCAAELWTACCHLKGSEWHFMFQEYERKVWFIC